MTNSDDGRTATSTGDPVISRVDVKERPMLANSLALIAGKFATMGLGFVSWVAAARLFDQADVGFASAVVSAMMLVVQIALFGTGSAVITLFASSRDRLKQLLDTSVSFVVVLSVSVALIGSFLAALFFDDLAEVLRNPVYLLAFLVMCVTGTLGVLFDQFSTVARRGDQVLIRGLASGFGTLAAILILAVAIDKPSPTPILLAWALGNAIPIGIAVVQLQATAPGYRFTPSIDRPLLTNMSRVGRPNWLLTLIERLPGTVLPIIALERLSAEANAAWYAAWMMAWVVYVVPIQVGINLFAESSRGEHSLRSIVRSGSFSSLMIGIPAAICAGIAAPYMLRILGPEYAEQAVTPLRILLLAVVPFTYLQAYFAICRSQQRFREGIAVCAIASGIGIVSATVAASRWELNGMAIAWLISQSAVSFWCFWRMRLLLPRDVTEGTCEVVGNGALAVGESAN